MRGGDSRIHYIITLDGGLNVMTLLSYNFDLEVAALVANCQDG